MNTCLVEQDFGSTFFDAAHKKRFVIKQKGDDHISGRNMATVSEIISHYWDSFQGL